MTLRPCIACSRHVAALDRVCPFCGTALAAKSPTPLVVTPGRLSRAAVFAGAALAGAACSSSSPAQTTPGGSTSTTTSAGSASTTQTTTPIEPNNEQSGVAAGTITGVIVSADTAQPVPGVTVRIFGPVDQQTRTDATGTYVLTNIVPGDYVLEWTLQPNHPRRQPAQQRLKVGAINGQRVDLTVHIPPPSSQKMPYGAPPRRKRVV